MQGYISQAEASLRDYAVDININRALGWYWSAAVLAICMIYQ